MDDNSANVLLKKQPPLPVNSILPREIKNDPARSEGDPESELPDVNEIKGTLRSEQPPLMKETLAPH
jgi:hypothetical protein